MTIYDNPLMGHQQSELIQGHLARIWAAPFAGILAAYPRKLPVKLHDSSCSRRVCSWFQRESFGRFEGAGCPQMAGTIAATCTYNGICMRKPWLFMLHCSYQWLPSLYPFIINDYQWFVINYQWQMVFLDDTLRFSTRHLRKHEWRDWMMRRMKTGL